MTMAVLLVQCAVAGCVSVDVAAMLTAVLAAMLTTVSIAVILVLGVHLRMMGMSDLLDDRIESVVLVRGVLHDASGSVCLLKRITTCKCECRHVRVSVFTGYNNITVLPLPPAERVRQHLSHTHTFHSVAISRLPRFLVIAGVMIVHTIVELVLGMIMEILVRMAAAVVIGLHNAAVAAMSENAVLGLSDLDVMSIMNLETATVVMFQSTVIFQATVMLLLVIVHRVIAVPVLFRHDGVRVQSRDARQNNGNLCASKCKT